MNQLSTGIRHICTAWAIKIRHRNCAILQVFDISYVFTQVLKIQLEYFFSYYKVYNSPGIGSILLQKGSNLEERKQDKSSMITLGWWVCSSFILRSSLRGSSC